MLSLVSAWTNGWINNQDAGDLIRHRAHYGVTVITLAPETSDEQFENMLFNLIYRIDWESISTENAQTSSAWWRHDTEILSTLVAICEHNAQFTGWPVTRVYSSTLTKTNC